MAKSYTYDAYGNTSSMGTFINSLAYTRAVVDPETGLYYMNARYYEPVTEGSFTFKEDKFDSNFTTQKDSLGTSKVDYGLLILINDQMCSIYKSVPLEFLSNYFI